MTLDNMLEKAWMWDQMDTSTELENWIAQNKPFNPSFPMAFGEPLGLANGFGESCQKISGECPFLDCGQIQNNYMPGTAWKYLVMVSISDLNNVSV